MAKPKPGQAPQASDEDSGAPTPSAMGYEEGQQVSLADLNRIAFGTGN